MLKKYLLASSLFCAFSASHAVVPGGMSSLSYTFPEKVGGYTSFDIDLQITDEPGDHAHIYWANQFWFNQGDGGYFGVQQHDNQTKLAIFSIWKATSWTNLPGVKCEHFTHEGSGVSCKIPYDWEEGVRYTLRLEKVTNSSRANTWQAKIINLSTKKATTIGEIQIPSTWQNLKPDLSPFIEGYAQGAQEYRSCNELRPNTSITFSPYANKTVPVNRLTYKNYGNCQSYAKTECTVENDCVTSVHQNALINQQNPFTLKNSINNLCADSLSGGSIMGLYYCDKNNHNQRFISNSSYNLKLQQRNLCLAPNAEGKVVATNCKNTTSQTWLPLGQSNRYLNAKTGKCIDAANGAVLLAPLQTYACLNNDYQRWYPTR